MNCVELVAYISQHGLHGEFHFTQQNDNSFEIHSKLETTLQYPDQIWSWGIHELPVDYREVKPNRRCHPVSVGKRIIDFDEHLGYLQLPGNESTKWQISAEFSGNFVSYFKAMRQSDLEIFPSSFRQNKYLGSIDCVTESG